jgi:hypothetical protein
MVRRDAQLAWLLAGVVSWGPESEDGLTVCGLAGAPGAYIDPVPFAPFIQRRLREGGLEPPASPNAIAQGRVTRNHVDVEWQNNAANATHLIIAAAPAGTENWSFYRLHPAKVRQRFQVPGAGAWGFAVQSCNNAGCSLWTDTIEVSPAR